MIGGGLAVSSTGVGVVVGGVGVVGGTGVVAGGVVNAGKVVTTPMEKRSDGLSKAEKATSPVRTAERTPGGLSQGKTVTDKQAVQRLRRGQDIFTASKQKAKQLQKKASGGAVHDEAHQPGYRPHYHGKGRTGGHAFHEQ
jgi:hypothetical protein